MSISVHHIIRHNGESVPDGATRTVEDSYSLYRLPDYDSEEGDELNGILNRLVDWDRLDEDCCGRYSLEAEEVADAIDGIRELLGRKPDDVDAKDALLSLKQALELSMKHGDVEESGETKSKSSGKLVGWLEFEVY